MFWRLILVYIDQSYSLLVIYLQCQAPQNLLVLILMASEAVVESSENVSLTSGAGLPCMAQRFLARDKALRGALVAGREKEGARRLWFLINGEPVSSHDHGFSNSLINHIENTKEIIV